MTPRFLRVRPSATDGRPVLELELVTGEVVTATLDRAHGRSVAKRIIECVDGRIGARLELELVVEPEAVPA